MARVPTVIKVQEQDQAREQVGRLGLRSFQLDDVLHEARQKVTSAQQEAAGFVEQARKEAGTIRQAARSQGFEAGFAEGQKTGRETGHQEAFEAARSQFAEQQASLIAACRQLIDQINDQRADWWAAARQDLIDLAIAIARRVACCVGQRERDVVAKNLEEAIQLVGRRSQITIQVNPADAEAARAFAGELMDRREHWKNVPVVESPQVSPGGCRLEWATGSVDATLQTQLDRIADELGDR
jgi:flagellar assembly protein FliH